MRKLIYAAILTTILTVSGCVNPPAKYASDTNLYNSIIIEVQAVKGLEPTRETFKILAKLFEKYKICSKENVLVVFKYPVKFPVLTWHENMLQSFEETFRAVIDTNPVDREYTVFISYLTGVYGRPGMDNIAGLQYGCSSLAVFGQYSGKPGASLLLHEFGHLFGMVRDRKAEPVNSNRPHHCNDRKCVMFWQWNKSGSFCDLCVKDINKIIAEKNKGRRGPI